MAEIQPLDYSMLLNAGRTFNPMQVYLQSQQVKGLQGENRLRDLQAQAAEQNISENKSEFDRKKAMQSLGVISVSTGQMMSKYSDLLKTGMSDLQARSAMQPEYVAMRNQLFQMGVLPADAKVPEAFDPQYLTTAHNMSVSTAQQLERAQGQANLEKTKAETTDIRGRSNDKQKEREKDIEIANINRRSAERIARMTHQQKVTALEAAKSKYAAGVELTDEEIAILRAEPIIKGAIAATTAFNPNPMKVGEEFGAAAYPYKKSADGQVASNGATFVWTPTGIKPK